MDTESLERIVGQAKKDPKFFHDLVFNPESALKDLDYLDRFETASLIGSQPEEILGRLIGIEGRRSAEEAAMDSCGWTCTDSCSWTCGTKSCQHTTGVMESRVES